MTTFLISIFISGAFSSNIWVGNLADAIGRRKAIIVGTITFLIGGTIQTAAQNLSMVLGGRFVAGMGIGMLAMLAPLYQAEVRIFQYRIFVIRLSLTSKYSTRLPTRLFVVDSRHYNSLCLVLGHSLRPSLDMGATMVSQGNRPNGVSPWPCKCLSLPSAPATFSIFKCSQMIPAIPLGLFIL